MCKDHYAQFFDLCTNKEFVTVTLFSTLNFRSHWAECFQNGDRVSSSCFCWSRQPSSLKAPNRTILKLTILNLNRSMLKLTFLKSRRTATPFTWLTTFPKTATSISNRSDFLNFRKFISQKTTVKIRKNEEGL